MKRILFDIGHPAHVHLFKNLIRYLVDRGHHVVVVSRDKDLTVPLLDLYHIDHVCISRAKEGALSMMGELAQRDIAVLKLQKKHRFQAAIGTAVSIAHLSALSSVRSFVFEEDDDDVVPLFARLTYPFASQIVIPRNLRFNKWKKKRICHDSYHELAYLHPDIFKPDEQVVEKYGLKPHSYIILRHSAYQAHHDWKEKGFSSRVWDDVTKIVKDYPVIKSHERDQKKDFDPLDMHHLLSFAKMIISDSQTMSMEASCLGIPSVRYSSFVGRISVLEELEHKYGLTFGFCPGNESTMLDKIQDLLLKKDLKTVWDDKRNSMLQEKNNFSDWMITFFNSLFD